MESADCRQNFEVELTHRTLLVQIVFKNYNEIVTDHLKSWFSNDSFVGKGRMFETGAEIALMFQNCVYDQLIEQTSAMSLSQVLEFVMRISKLVSCETGKLEKLFREKKIIGQTYDVTNLICLARLKFAITIITKLVHREDEYEKCVNQENFETFNGYMKLTIEKLMPRTNTLA